MASDFEHADRLALQRELLSIRSELFQARKTKDAITAELVGLAGRLHAAQQAANMAAEDAASMRDELARAVAQHDELRREIAALAGQLADQSAELSAELARRNAVARRLNDELVRRDLELLDLRADLHTSQRESHVLRGELDGRWVTVEQLLAVLSVLQAARAQRDAPAGPRPGLLRRAGRRIRRLLRSTRAALVHRTAAR
jgi:chromosome segregation ATPase